ncbi:hypothetical protein HA466_0103120 [Hirschfeldia incana]|nr:hypothetical protein HA466_0103120 [Hirschfeldia incana]
MGRYSYTQPSQSESYGLRDKDDNGHSSTEFNIMLDQAEIEAARTQFNAGLSRDRSQAEIEAARVQYPPQPEVDHVASESDYQSELNQVTNIHFETELKLAELENTVS